MEFFYCNSGVLLICILFSIIDFVHLVKPSKFKDCNKGRNSIANITRFTVSPDPVSLSRPITASVDINLYEDVPPGALFRTKVYKVSRIFGVALEIPAPCVAGLGSCTTDHCKFLNSFKDQACPFFPPGSECGCPVKAGYYGGDSVTVPMPNLGSLLKRMASGDFKIIIELIEKEKYKEKTLACYTFTGTARP